MAEQQQQQPKKNAPINPDESRNPQNGNKQQGQKMNRSPERSNMDRNINQKGRGKM